MDSVTLATCMNQTIISYPGGNSDGCWVFAVIRWLCHCEYVDACKWENFSPLVSGFPDVRVEFCQQRLVEQTWILRVLKNKAAPVWIIRCTEYILFGRSIRHKVQGRLLPPRVIWTGVDMGNAFSVLLFCIAMDTFLTASNSLQGTLSIQGYADDTTIAGSAARDLTWMAVCNQICLALQFACIKVEQHERWTVCLVSIPHYWPWTK